ncbi:MAG: hypothetical protein NPIRA06_22820 [Nitrospirales bacterium]|nr:MAG: hypothetical protein NPIRA06_22820 [Nitrospirales bacterium]
MSFSEILSGLAAIVSLGALLYAHRSATAAEASARTAQEALSFQRQTYANEQSDRREERLSLLAKEAIINWPTYGSLVPILTREKDLSAEEQEDLARRVYSGLSRSEEDALSAVRQWRQMLARK